METEDDQEVKQLLQIYDLLAGDAKLIVEDLKGGVVIPATELRALIR